MKKLLLTLTIIFISLTNYIYAGDALSFTLTTIDDKNITISETKDGLDFHEFRGKAVLLTLFGHRCPPCIKEIPDFIELTNKHKNDLAIVAIESQGYPSESVQEFVSDHKINYNVVAGIDHGEFINYIAETAFPKNINEDGEPRGIPLPLLIAVNKNGEVESVQAGRIREDELEILIKDLND